MRYFIDSLFLTLSIMLTGCEKRQLQITNLSMLAGGKTFAVPTGTVGDQFVRQRPG